MKIFDAHNCFRVKGLYSFMVKGVPSHEDVLDFTYSDRLLDGRTMMGHNDRRLGWPSRRYRRRPSQDMPFYSYTASRGAGHNAQAGKYPQPNPPLLISAHSTRPSWWSSASRDL